MLKHIRDAIGLGLAWFITGAFIGLIVFEGLVDPDGKIADVWPAVLGYPAFFGGAVFLTLTRTFAGRRRLHEVSLRQAALLGAASGPLLAGIVLLGLGTGILGNFKGDQVPWSGIAQVTGLMIPAFAIAGWISVWTATRAETPVL